MLRRTPLLLVVLLLASMLAACGGGDADPTATTAPSAAATPTAAAATPTSPPAASEASPTAPAASPTVVATATPTEAASPAPAPTRLIPTPTPQPPASTPTAPVAEWDEQSLLELAHVQPEELRGAWSLDGAFIPSAVEEGEGSVCNVAPFEQRETRLARLRAELSEGAIPAFIIHDLAAFPVDIAPEAMAYAQESAASCTEWTNSEGQTFTVAPLDDPQLGDESFAVRISFTTQGTDFDSDWYFVRVEGFVMSLTYVTAAGGDIAPGMYAAQLAAAKLTAVAESPFFPEFDPEVLVEAASLLLVRAELEELSEGWTNSRVEIPYNEDRYGVCGAAPFPDMLGAYAEIAADFEGDPNNGPFVWHSIVVLEEGAGPAAMEFIRESMSCTVWEDEGDQIPVQQIETSLMGDDAFAVLATLDVPDVATVNVEYLFVQTGDVITVIGYAVLGELDPAVTERIAQAALFKLSQRYE
jgi:hypothetical protein